MPIATSTIHSLLELSQKEGALSALHASVGENAHKNMEMLLSMAKGSSRHIRLDDRDLWLAFEPATLSLREQSSSGTLDAGNRTVTAAATGSLLLYVSTDAGQVFSSTVSKMVESSLLNKSDDELVSWLLRQADPTKTKIAVKGKLQNRLDSTIVDRSQSQAVGQMLGWYPFGEDHLGSGNSHAPEKSDIMSRSGSVLNHLGGSPETTPYWSVDLHVERFFSSTDFYKQIMGTNLAGAQPSDEFTAMLTQFRAELSQTVRAGRAEAMQAATEKQFKKIQQSGAHIDLSSAVSRQIYSLPVMNFIAGGNNADTVRYRAQFIEQTLALMLGPDWTRPEVTVNMDLSTLGVKLKKLIASRYNGDVVDDVILKAIDAGRYPSKELSEKWRLPNMGGKQFKRAMSLIGGYASLQQNKNGLDLQLYALTNLAQHHEDAATIAKLPEEWFYWGDEKWDVLTIEGVTALSMNSKRYEHDETRRVLQLTLPHLINTGRAYDALKGEMAAMHDAGQDVSATKQKIRELGLQWRWMTSGPGTLATRFKEFDKKYKLLASYKDYPMVLDTLIKSVLYRCALDHPHLSKDVFLFDENHATLQLNEGALNDELLSHLADGMNETEMVWDEDLQEEVEVEAESPADLYGTISLPYVESLRQAISAQETDLRVPVRLNDELHKVYSRFLRDANEGSKTNIKWTPLLNDILPFTGFELHSISDRLELLTEGTEMQHCVFSYLSKCLQGESVILSAREPGTGRRLATIELSPERAETENGEEFASFELVQCYGYANSRSAQIDEIRDQVKLWLVDVNNGIFPTNGITIMDDDSHLTEVYAKVESDPSQYGALLEPIPYNEDGVFLSYYLFNKYTPANMTVESVMTGNTLLGEMYWGSQFRLDIEKIERMASRFQMEPEQVVHTKMKHQIPDWDGVEKRLALQGAVIEQVRSVISTYAETLTPDQCFQKVADTISSHNLSFVDTYSPAQFQRDLIRDDAWIHHVISNPPSQAQGVTLHSPSEQQRLANTLRRA